MGKHNYGSFNILIINHNYNYGILLKLIKLTYVLKLPYKYKSVKRAFLEIGFMQHCTPEILLGLKCFLFIYVIILINREQIKLLYLIYVLVNVYHNQNKIISF